MPLEKYECWHCGKLLEKGYEPMPRVYCEECQSIAIQEHKKLVSEYVKLKTRIMFDTAVRTMEKSGRVYMYEYKNACDEVWDAMKDHTDVFLSSDEVIVAIVLIEYGIEFIPNYQIGKYKADFYIPEFKVCLEVDGHLHKFKEEFDSKRDIDIRCMLGSEWEVIRIPTKYIEKDPSKIPDAIEQIAERKREIRKKNSGIIPEDFSNRERKYYNKIGEHICHRIKK